MPVSLRLALKKYNGIWGLKKHLYEAEIPDPWLLQIYGSYFKNYGSWVGYNSRFDSEPCLPHGLHGVFITGGAHVGRNVVIFHQVTIGSNTLNGTRNSGYPTIGDNVYIGAGAKIVGNVVVGNNCRIGANAVVYQDIPENSVVVQSPTRVIQKTDLDNRHYSKRNGKWVFFQDGGWVEDPDKSD